MKKFENEVKEIKTSTAEVQLAVGIYNTRKETTKKHQVVPGVINAKDMLEEYECYLELIKACKRLVDAENNYQIAQDKYHNSLK
jgi:homoserine kinase